MTIIQRKWLDNFILYCAKNIKNHIIKFLCILWPYVQQIFRRQGCYFLTHTISLINLELLNPETPHNVKWQYLQSIEKVFIYSQRLLTRECWNSILNSLNILGNIWNQKMLTNYVNCLTMTYVFFFFVSSLRVNNYVELD